MMIVVTVIIVILLTVNYVLLILVFFIFSPSYPFTKLTLPRPAFLSLNKTIFFE